MFDFLKNNINKFDLLVIADYGHGVMTEKIRKLISQKRNKVFLNTQINSFNRGYHNVTKYKKINTLVTNEAEVRFEMKDKNSKIINLIKKLSRKISAQNIIVTRGKDGAVLLNCKNNSVITCPAFNQSNVDTIGAGDTFFAICSLLIGSKVTNSISMLIASIFASISIDQQGKKYTFSDNMLKKNLTHMFK